MSHAFEVDAEDPWACRHCLLGELAHVGCLRHGRTACRDCIDFPGLPLVAITRARHDDLPDTDIRGAMAAELERMGLMTDQPDNTGRSDTAT